MRNKIQIISGLLIIAALLLTTLSTPAIMSDKVVPAVATPNAIDEKYSGVVHSGQVLGAANGSIQITVSVTLQYRNVNQLDSFLSAVQNPLSPLYHKYLSKEQFISDYSPSDQEYSAYANYFRSQGFAVSTYNDHVSLFLNGTVDQFQNVFHTSLMTYSGEHRTYIAPSSQLSLSVNYGAITGVTGLNTKLVPHISPLFQGSGTSETLYGADMQAAYQLNKLYQSTGFPTNETIATILWSGANSSGVSVAPFVPSDISYYFNHNLPANQPKSKVYGYPLSGAPLPGPSAANDQTQANFESTLDLEMAGSTAPGANLVEVYGPAASLGFLDMALGAILNPSYNATVNTALSHVVAVSNSWGTTDTNDSTWMQYEQQAAARGITVLVSSGDNGNTNSPPPSYPATMAYGNFGTLAVGGTQITLSGTTSQNGSGTTGVSTQSVWYNTPSAGYGSQGGVSSVYKEPSWQKNSADANSVITGASSVTGIASGRGTPDVSGDGANMEVYLTYGGFTSYQELWGTSIASPLVAGVIATIDHSLGPPEGFMNPLVYRLGQAEYNGSYAGAPPFYFVSNGSNGKFSANNGYSLAVGWGSINAYNFVMDQSGAAPVAPATYKITFSETGLPSGTGWYVNVTGKQSLHSTSSTVLIMLTNGTYTYSVASGNNSYKASGNTITVKGGSLSVPVKFSKIATYSVSFSESGLPSGVVWYVNITGAASLKSTGTSTGTSLINGTYAYTVSTQDKVFSATGGSFTVAGRASSISIQFKEITYPVKFTESNLPSNTVWYVNLTGQKSGPITATGYTFNLVNGTYSYTVATLNKTWKASAGSFTLKGSAKSISVPFSLMKYSVTFTESGLPSGTVWNVNLSNSASALVTTSSYSVSLINGTYSYSVYSYNKSYAAPAGVFTVKGSALKVNIQFSSVRFAVTFVESGLPSGYLWYVNITGEKSLQSNLSSITIDLVNGTYSYIISPQNKSFHSLSGNIAVDGTTVNVSVNLTPVTYSVTFTQSGLPSGTVWYVNLSDFHSGPILGAKYSLQLKNGTYGYAIETQLKIFHAAGGEVVVNGSNITRAAVFYPVLYKISLTEQTLPHNMLWNVSISGIEKSSRTGFMEFNLSNGTYEAVISNTSEYYAVKSSILLSVEGSNTSVIVLFEHYSYITAYNVPANSTVYLNGIPLHLVHGILNLSVIKGNYSLEILNSNFKPYYKNFTLAPGEVKNLTVKLSARPTGGIYALKLPFNEVMMLTGAIALIALLGVGGFKYKKR